MARPRTPTARLELNGAFKKNPQRGRERRSEPVPTGPLGPPPDRLTKEQKEAWFELQEMVPARVLTNADRWIVELACRLMAKLRTPEGLLVGEFAQLIQCLSRMGLTPADRSKVGVNKDQEEDNPFAALAAESGKPN